MDLSSPSPRIFPALCCTYIRELGCTARSSHPSQWRRSLPQLPRVYTPEGSQLCCPGLELQSFPTQQQVGAWYEDPVPLPPAGFKPVRFLGETDSEPEIYVQGRGWL